MTQIFISDLHLDEGLPTLKNGFLGFIETINDSTDELYILGDFFETWLGDDHDTTFNKQVIEALRQFSGKTFLMHGNRDFLIGEVFCEAAGVELLVEPAIIETPAGKALLLHGDSLCTLDSAYMEARKLLRSESFQKDFLQKTIAERALIAQQIRGKSNAHTRESAADIMDVTPGEVVDSLKNAGVSMMIHGHTHRPAVHQLSVENSPATRYVLGDWGSSMQYLLIEDSEPQLLTYDLGSPE